MALDYWHGDFHRELFNEGRFDVAPLCNKCWQKVEWPDRDFVYVGLRQFCKPCYDKMDAEQIKAESLK